MKTLRAITILGWLILAVCFFWTAAFGAPIALAWDAVPDASSYRIWRGTDILTTPRTPLATVDLPVGQSSTLTLGNYADDTAAGTAGLTAGMLYQTSGAVKVKP